MEADVGWLILGLMLIGAELLSGTFYLLILGIAAMAGALAAYLGASVSIQAILVSVVGVIGVVLVNRWRKNRTSTPHGANNSMDIGQPVVFESWTDQSAGLARVKYRGASWDAHLVGNSAASVNDVLYICGTEGSRLQVSRASTHENKL